MILYRRCSTGAAISGSSAGWLRASSAQLIAAARHGRRVYRASASLIGAGSTARSRIAWRGVIAIVGGGMAVYFPLCDGCLRLDRPEELIKLLTQEAS